CTWTSSVSVSAKNITLQGAGKDLTVITIDGVTGAVKLNTTGSRVTGFGFILNSGDQMIIAQGQNFRVDNNRFDNRFAMFREAVTMLGEPALGVPHPTGVVDSNQFLNARTLVLGDLDLVANSIWAQPSTIGNPNQTGVVYVE